MNAFGKTLAVVVGLALLGALGAGAYFVVAFMFGLFSGLESQAAKLTACASAVALLAAIIVASSIREAGAQIAKAVLELRKDLGSDVRGGAAAQEIERIVPRAGKGEPAPAAKDPLVGGALASNP